LPATRSELRRPIGSDEAVAARATLDQKPTRLPVHMPPAAERERPAEPPSMRDPQPDGLAPVRPAAGAQRLPRGADATAPSVPPAAAPPRRRASGFGRFLLWIGLLGVLPVLLAAAAAYTAANYLDELHGGRSEIMFHLPELAGDAANRFLATQPVVVRSYPVVEPVARAEAMPVEDLLDNLDASMVQGSTLMRIEYHDVDAERIVRVLEGVTMGYLSLLRDIALIEGASHRILSAPYLLEDPVSPRPLRAAAIGAVVGLAVAFAGLVILAQLRRPTTGPGGAR